jgi:hypothetical protein
MPGTRFVWSEPQQLVRKAFRKSGFGRVTDKCPRLDSVYEAARTAKSAARMVRRIANLKRIMLTKTFSFHQKQVHHV